MRDTRDLRTVKRTGWRGSIHNAKAKANMERGHPQSSQSRQCRTKQAGSGVEAAGRVE